LLSPLNPSRRWRTSPQRRKHSSIARMIWLCGSTRQPVPIITGANGGTARLKMEPMSAEMRRFGQGCGPREARTECVRSRAPVRRSTSPGLFVHPWAQVNCQAGDPSTRTHSRSAASASSKIAAAALGLPIRYTSAAAVWSRQMVPIPLRVRMAKARSSVAVRRIIGAI
jgi:hypothetical protein